MKRLAAVAVVILLVRASLGAREEETYAPRGAHFEVKFPGKPKEATSNAKSKLGKLKVVTATFATSERNVLMVSYTDFPEGSGEGDKRDALIEGVRKGLKGKDGSVLSDKEVKIGKDQLPGQELLLDKGKEHVRVRIVLRNDRLFQIGAIGTRDFVGGKETEAFLDSFEFRK